MKGAKTSLASIALIAVSSMLPGWAAASGTSDPWATAYAKAALLISNMTLLELNNITLGFANTSCSGQSGSVPRLGFPGLCFQDAGNGVRGQDGVSSFASGVSIGASWNTELAYQRAKYMGAEFQRKGVHVALGPVVGPIGRIAEGGRSWEGFGADPYLDGMLTIPTVKGLQESVMACTKHYIAYEQETNRSVTIEAANPNGFTVSSNVDDKTLHELYLWPFEDAVQAGTASIMCSYNRINDSYACNNNHTLNGLLKDELGFKGFVVSDWGAQHSGLDTAVNGLDVVMPDSVWWEDGGLAAAVRNGTLTRARLEDMAMRTVAAWYYTGLDSSLLPAFGVGETTNLSAPHSFVNARDPASAPNLLQQAQEGHVLVKNVNGALPLRNTQVISLFGYDATANLISGPDWRDIYYAGNLELFIRNWQDLGYGAGYAYEAQNIAPQKVNGTLITGGGSGGNTPPYVSTPFDAITNRAIVDGTQLYWNFDSTDPYVESASDACLVFLNAFASEGWDRWSGLTDESSDSLVNNVASKCGNTMVFIHNAGIRLVDAWIDHPNVTAVMFAHLPGQDAGRALTSLIYGDVSPSGRLPYTVAKKESDYGSLLGPCISPINTTSPQCDFTEGVNIDYRSFLARNVTPRYEFGYGLTYSSFSYADFAINMNTVNASIGLFDIVGTVSARIKNTGNYSTAEVSQLYLQMPGADTRTLRGFAKTDLAPGASKPVTFELRKKDISTWDSSKKQWVQPSGKYSVFVGASVLDIKLQGAFTI